MDLGVASPFLAADDGVLPALPPLGVFGVFGWLLTPLAAFAPLAPLAPIGLPSGVIFLQKGEKQKA